MPLCSKEQLKGLIFPATTITRCVPLPPFADHKGNIIYYGDNEPFLEVFKDTVPLLELKSEKQLHALWGFTGLISAFYGLLSETSNWAVLQGVPKPLAEAYAANMYSALAELAVTKGETSFDEMSQQAATSGGLNEYIYAALKDAGHYDIYYKALDVVLSRFPD